MLALTLLLLPIALAANGFQCKQGSSIPYCVYAPEASNGKLPLMVFMPGSGARGSLGNAASLATYDGHGKMINEYLSGNTDEKHTTAATKFVTVVPISPDGSRHFWPEDILAIIKAVRSEHGSAIAGSKTHISGYSMGSRGCNRFLVTYPDQVASAGCSAGAAEEEGTGTLTQDPSRTASATFPLLSNAVNLAVRNFAGMSDTTAGWTSGQAEQAELVKLGSKKAVLTELQGVDHSGMSIKPWTDTDYLDWALKQSSGSSSSSGGSKTQGSPTATATHKKPHKTTSVALPTSTSEVEPDEEDPDCDDSIEEPDTSEEEEEACEDEEESSTEEEECEEEEETEETPVKRSVEANSSASFAGRAPPHRFIFPRAGRGLSSNHHARGMSGHKMIRRLKR